MPSLGPPHPRVTAPVRVTVWATELQSLGGSERFGGIGENHETLQIMANAGNDAFGDKFQKISFNKDIS